MAPLTEDNPELVPYRLEGLDKLINEFRTEFKDTISKLATREYLELRIAPLEDAHKTFILDRTAREAADHEREILDQQRDTQFKIALFTALGSPLIAAAISIFVAKNH